MYIRARVKGPRKGWGEQGRVMASPWVGVCQRLFIGVLCRCLWSGGWKIHGIEHAEGDGWFRLTQGGYGQSDGKRSGDTDRRVNDQRER